jgi:BirA family biotin operon repressor/biotin-[acetyl-CoA-carboxylase] ligase
MSAISFRVLRLLADGEFHSGVEIARELGVSRGTVWNAVGALDAAGVEIYRVRSRGYRLPYPLSLLDRAAVARHAGFEASRFAIEVVEVAESTNTALMQRAAAGAANGTVIAAEWQQSGRGRMGRAWHAGLGGGITFSLLWRFTQGAGALAGLSLAAGVGVVRAISKLGAGDVELKWPNDVLWRGGKLAGMLIEMQGDALGPSAVAIGIGVNVRLSDAIRSRIDQPAADLETACGRAIDRSQALGVMLEALALVLDTFSREGFAPLRAEWERYHAYQGREVSVTLPGGRTDVGVAQGVGDDGALIFQARDTVRRLHSGELSLRLAAAPSRDDGASGARARSRA